ncbi:hypothetical protein [Oceanobacillus limi]|nr:hypothetical protein [Oceanobacillus limi]
MKQCILSNGKKEQGINYPITQAENQKFLLQNWFYNHNINDIPTYYFIAFSDPSTIIEVKGDQQSIADVVAHGEQIPQMIINKDSELPNRFQDYKLGKVILKECGEFDFDILGNFQVTAKDVMPGGNVKNVGGLE